MFAPFDKYVGQYVKVTSGRSGKVYYGELVKDTDWLCPDVPQYTVESYVVVEDDIVEVESAEQDARNELV